jgi:hypothetical protein
MEDFLDPHQYDLATPDGAITDLTRLDDRTAHATVFIQNISPKFVGFQIDLQSIFFNIKSTLAQLGLNGVGNMSWISKISALKFRYDLKH